MYLGRRWDQGIAYSLPVVVMAAAKAFSPSSGMRAAGRLASTHVQAESFARAAGPCDVGGSHGRFAGS